MAMDELCIVCDEKATQKCGRCLGPAYCNKEHQKQHWASHKNECQIYRIERSPDLGRYLVAFRDIKPGEIILKDDPLVLGPKQVTIPRCLGCSTPVDGSYVCTLCGWPLCNAECQKIVFHRAECEISQRRNPKIKINKFYQTNPMYECITPLRCLWMRENRPDRWETMMEMESHVKDREGKDIYNAVQTNIINFSKIYLKAEEFDDEEFHKVCGILDVNGFEIPQPEVIGLYGKACLLENSCIPNTARTFDAKLNIIVRATVPIMKGEHITACYTDPMWGTNNRNIQLTSTKYFECKCKRCVDPTELGTHLSSLKCQSTCKGLVIPVTKKKQQVWKCNTCGNIMKIEEVIKLLKDLGETLVSLQGDISRSENFLKSTLNVLSENHYYRNEVKLALAQIYGNQGLQLSAAPETMLKRKLGLCEEVLKTITKFTPGPVRLRGILFNEIYRTYYQLYKKLNKSDKSNEAGKNLLEDALKNADEAVRILILESPIQDEFRLSVSAQNDLKEIKALLQKIG